MHTTTPTIMSMESNKPCDDEHDRDVLKQENQDLVGLLLSPDTKPRHEVNGNGVKSEHISNDIKEEIKEENSIKTESSNPGSVGKMPNGDAGSDIDKKVDTPADNRPQEKAKMETNGNPNTPVMADSHQQHQQQQQQQQQTSQSSMGGPMHRNTMNTMNSVMSPGSAHMSGPPMCMGPVSGPQGPVSSQMSHMSQPGGPGSIGPMGPGHGPPNSGPGMCPSGQPGMMGGPMGSGPMGGGPMGGPGGMGPSGGMGPMGPQQQQVASEGQMMQQQSEIFVFTTQLANAAAQAVQAGQYKNLLAFHMDQPDTKKFLQKHPKSRGGPGMGPMYGMQGMRGKMGMMSPSMGPMGMGGPPGGPGGPGGPMGYGPGPNSSSVAQWVQQQNQNLQEQGLGMNDGDPRMMMGPNNPNFSQMMMDDRMFDEFTGPMNNMNLMQNKVPNENLTPEQLQRREEQLANLRKIHQMLLGSGGQGPGPGGQGMMPGDMGNMGMYQHNMMASKRGMMSSQPGMMGSPHGMMDSRPDMMSQEQFMMSQGMSQFGPGPHPQNMQNMNPAQREWMRLQQEYIAEKRQHMQQRQSMGQNGPQMGPGGPGMDPSRSMQGQPPPPYYSSIAQKQRHGSVGLASPTSPNMNGPMGSPGMPPGGPDHDPMMFPSHQRKGSFSGMDPVGGPMGPGMGPGMDPMMQQGSPMNPTMGHMGNMSSHALKNSQVSLQRAGNPEQFVPDIPPPVSGSMANSSTNKPPPSYAQSQSTKRKREEMEELCKNLQPTPSPQHISYLNQFDGQELTITKQINSAYRDTNTSESQQSNHFNQSNQVVNSPMHGPSSNKGPMSNSSQTSSGPLASPGPVNNVSQPGQGPGPSPMSGANMRLSHYDPQQQPPQNSSISNSPTTPTGKSSLSNITSASLANLAKGVENLSNQMQQHMMQGGPFHSIQLQSQQQQSGQGQTPPQHSQPNQSQQTSSSQSTNQHQAINSIASSNSPQTHASPSGNNTYVSANLSIQQVNIQSVNHSNSGGGGSNSTAMQMSMEQNQMSMQQQQQQQMGGVGSSMASSSSMTPTGSMSQSQVSITSTNMTPSSMSNMVSKMHPANSMSNVPMSCSSSMPQGYPGMGPPGMHSNKMSPYAPSHSNPMNSMMNQQVPTSGRSSSPGYPPSSMGNANVQIQQKAPNTIQYLPANQSSMPPENKNMKPDLDFMNQFPMMGGGMEPSGKVPTSKIPQYFQGGGPPGVSSGSMGPYGPGNMGPGQDSRMNMGQDMRFSGQGMPMGGDPRMDPRMGPSMGDPRMGPMGPGADPRMARHDPRMGPDMGMSPDPRMGPGGPGPGPGGMGPMSDPRMSDPRMGPNGGSMMGMGPSGPLGSMRPGSRGSPYSCPIGPAVQQSMMMRRASPDPIPSMGGSSYSMSGMGSPDPMNPGMNNPMGNPMSALSSMSGNPMTSMSNMSSSIMSDSVGMSGGPNGGMGPSMPYNSPPYSGQMSSSMMPSGPPSSMSMQVPRMQGPGMGGMSRAGPYSRQASPGMRMSGPGMGPGPLSPGAPAYSTSQYQQFQQQLYSQNRPRQMSPMDSMMGNPGGPGYGPMGPGPGPGMMQNIHGPM